jgi:F-type H+-transporting ATPase subunit epsilon
MNLEILTPEKKLFSDEVYGVQLPGVGGSFEILEKHAPMVSALSKGTIKVLVDKGGNNVTSFQVTGGFVEIINNKATVLVESGSQV